MCFVGLDRFFGAVDVPHVDGSVDAGREEDVVERRRELDHLHRVVVVVFEQVSFCQLRGHSDDLVSSLLR